MSVLKTNSIEHQNIVAADYFLPRTQIVYSSNTSNGPLIFRSVNVSSIVERGTGRTDIFLSALTEIPVYSMITSASRAADLNIEENAARIAILEADTKGFQILTYDNDSNDWRDCYRVMVAVYSQ